MPRIRVVKIVFDTELKDYEIPAFRGAIIDLVGREHVIYHNHLGDDKFHYKYPVIQYKKVGRKACLVCIKEGVDEIHQFFLRNEGKIKIGNDQRTLLVENVQINSYGMDVTDQFQNYAIQKWLPINTANFKKFEEFESLIDQIQFLEKVLIGNILSMAKGLDWHVDKPIEVKITNIRNQYLSKLKGQQVLTFDLDFKTNVFLPYDMGLGKSTSLGYGTINKATIKKSMI